MAFLSGVARVIKQRHQERKLVNALAYGSESLKAFLNQPTNTNLLSHQRIAELMIKKRAHGALAENLHRLGNLSLETRTELVKKGHASTVQKHATSFVGAVDESTQYSG